jgi:hypothetical protein
MENKNNEECIFCFSFLFSNIKIDYKDNPILTSTCFLNHQKQLNLSKFLENNDKSFDNVKLKVKCPSCKEYLDKDNFFMCLETNKLICPKCIALNIIISSSSNKKKKKGKAKKDNKIKNEPHYVTLISLLKDSLLEKNEINIFDEKYVEQEKNDINEKYKEYKDIIIREKYYKMLMALYNFLCDLYNLKKKITIIYKENKGYLPKRFSENVKNISSFDDLFKIFLNNFTPGINNQDSLSSKELKNMLISLKEHYQNKIDKSILINKILLNEDKNKIKCIYQQESIISYILNFQYEINLKQIENYLIISSNNGIISILNYDNYKPIYVLDIFQSKGVYHLIQSKKEKNVIYASSWGCFKKIKLNREINNETNTITFAYSILKTYKKSDIIRILKLIEIPKIYRSKDNQHEIISLDEGGHVILWGYNQEQKKDLKEEIFVADREDSINNMILFESNKITNKLIFTTRNSTLFGCIHFYSIEDSIAEVKCMKNSYNSKKIYFDLQYNNLTQINDYMIAFPQNKKLIIIDVRYYQIITTLELQTELEKEKFYNNYGETIAIISYENKLNNYIFIFSSKRCVYEYLFEKNDLIYLGKIKLDEIEENIEAVFNIGKNNIKDKIYLILNKKILLINLDQE